MANLLTFTTPIAIANLRRAQIVGAVQVDETASRMLVPVQLQGGGGSPIFDTPFVLSIANGACDALAVDAAPVSSLRSVAVVQLGGAGVATAFDTALAAYSGANRRSALLTALIGISGVVQAGAPAALVGTIVPILPAGAVT